METEVVSGSDGRTYGVVASMESIQSGLVCLRAHFRVGRCRRHAAVDRADTWMRQEDGKTVSELSSFQPVTRWI